MKTGSQGGSSKLPSRSRKPRRQGIQCSGTNCWRVFLGESVRRLAGKRRKKRQQVPISLLFYATPIETASPVIGLT